MAKVALVTGGNRGIGRAAALELARRGFDIGITYRIHRGEAARTVADIERLGRTAYAESLDLVNPAHGLEAIETLTAKLGGLDVLVNNAGVNWRGSFLDLSLDDFLTVINVNLLGPVLCAQAAAHRMLVDGTHGRIINVTSVLGQAPLGRALAYCAAKAGMDAATRVMALELAREGIAVNAVAVGHTATAMNGFAEDVDVLTVNRPTIPIGRPGDPREIAKAIAFLCDADSSYMTGSNLLVDGGLLLVQGPTLLAAATVDPERRDS
jgi:NAD(P)-dependent dehydrogenase (short-subunit alcohol dehydrogenase family)